MQTDREISFWKQRWIDADTPWDLKGSHPLLSRLLLLAQSHSPHPTATKRRAYVPACGTSHDGAALAQVGWTVVAEDIVPQAIDTAKKLHPIPGLTARVGDSLKTDPEDAGEFDLIYDRAAYCAMQPQMRDPFLAANFLKLRSGGLFCSILFTKIRGPLPPEGGPPFEITISQMATMIKEWADLLAVEEHTIADPSSRIEREGLFVAIKR